MKVVDNESTIFVDVDDTLIMWNPQLRYDKDFNKIDIKSPDSADSYFTVTPHKGHIKVLKDRKARGSCIVVWSAGGYKWAEAVVKALDLENHVDYCMTKPHMYIDDKKAEEFMQERLYIPFGNGYGE